jgi:transposase
MTLRVRALSEEEAHRLAWMTRSQKLGGGTVQSGGRRTVPILGVPSRSGPVAMESTGVYWIPAFELLDQRGFDVVLVN